MRAPLPAWARRQAVLHWQEGRLETGWRPHSDRGPSSNPMRWELTGMPAQLCGPISPSLRTQHPFGRVAVCDFGRF